VNLELAAVALDEPRERSIVSGNRRADDLLLDRVRRRRLLPSLAGREDNCRERLWVGLDVSRAPVERPMSFGATPDHTATTENASEVDDGTVHAIRRPSAHARRL
jgi:hypothetical protein